MLPQSLMDGPHQFLMDGPHQSVMDGNQHHKEENLYIYKLSSKYLWLSPSEMPDMTRINRRYQRSFISWFEFFYSIFNFMFLANQNDFVYVEIKSKLFDRNE